MSTISKLKTETKTVRPTGHAAVYALRDYMCKWPIGEPGKAGFYFCGKRCKEGSPYCEAHALEALRT